MIELDIGNVYSDIHFARSDMTMLKNILDWGFKIEVPGAEYLWEVKSGAWDGKAHLWDNTPVNTTIQMRTGLLPRLCGLMNNSGLAWTVLLDRRKLPQQPVLNQTNVPLRPYQYEALTAAFRNTSVAGWWPRGVLEIATGGGKTELAVAMYEMNPRPTMFLVHRKDLLLQAKERFERYGYQPGVLGAGHFDPQPGLNIATMQTLHSLFTNPDTGRSPIAITLAQDSEQVFFDECHLMASNIKKGNEFVYVADQLHAAYRWGLTATPFMRSQYDNMLLESVSGYGLYEISARALIDMGYLTEPIVVIKKVPGKLAVTMDWRKAKSNKARAAHWRKVEEKGIKFNEIRTNLIIDEIEAGPYPLLVLVKTVDQANFIGNLYATKTGKTIPFLSGKNTAKERRAAVAGLRDGSLPTLLATTIFDEGVDIPELRTVVLASGGKSQVKLIQRAGRSLRLADNKNGARVVDFGDQHHPKLREHAKERERVWKEQHFRVRHEDG